MKRYFAILMTVISLTSVLCSCQHMASHKTDVWTDGTVMEEFRDCMSLEEIIKETEKIDFYYKPDTSGLTSEIVEDKENNTKDTHWKDNKGNIVYVYYEGYGEKCFDYYTKLKSGKDVKVKYADNDGERYSVSVTCDDFSIEYFDLNKESEYGADCISVSSKKNNGSILYEGISYEYNDNRWTVYPACFTDNEGYKEYYTYYDEEDNKMHSSSRLLHRCVDTEPECKEEMLTDGLVTYMPEIIVPRYNLSYLKDPDSGKWYMTADFVLTFETEELRDEYAAKYGITESEDYGDEDSAVTLRTGKITIPFEKNYDGLESLVNIREVDDDYYMSVGLNGKGEIESLSYGSYSLY